MDFLKAEIERKRKLHEEQQQKLKSKYIKVGDLERIREQEYLQKQQLKEPKADPVEEPKEAKLAAADDELTMLNYTENQIRVKFRSKGLPIRLFGESDKERLIRLKKSESLEERKAEKPFHDLVKQNDANLKEEMMKDSSLKESEKYKVDLNTYSQIDTSAISVELLKNEPEHACYLISVYLKRLLLEWESTLQSRSDEEKMTDNGKLETVFLEMAKDNLKPLFKGLKKRTISEKVLVRVAEMCYYMQLREYMKANDVYIVLSIGRAAWPIGVTMVGIHERKGRDKIQESQIGHVLNDEVQRKWIQSFKRLMTFAQKRWPPDSLAKQVG